MEEVTLQIGARCAQCGAAIVRRSRTQRYCDTCSARRDLERKRRWAREHPPSAERREHRANVAECRKELARQAGLAGNTEAKRSIAWCDAEGPYLLWQARVAVPFSYAASKNHIYAMRRCGHVALRRESRSKRQEIAWTIRSALAGRHVVHNKVWIDILVQKPNHRGDAVNVVDLVCDAVKDALPIDDRWFCIRRLDWEIVKLDPQLFIGIGQESAVDAQVCSYCGQIRPLSEFNIHRDQPLGVGRECKHCRTLGRRLARARTRPVPAKAVVTAEPEPTGTGPMPNSSVGDHDGEV